MSSYYFLLRIYFDIEKRVFWPMSVVEWLCREYAQRSDGVLECWSNGFGGINSFLSNLN
jgi:hypothetical protein